MSAKPDAVVLPAIPQGDRFTDITKFRLLGKGSHSVLYECWDDAIRAYATRTGLAGHNKNSITEGGQRPQPSFPP